MTKNQKLDFAVYKKTSGSMMMECGKYTTNKKTFGFCTDSGRDHPFFRYLRKCFAQHVRICM